MLRLHLPTSLFTLLAVGGLTVTTSLGQFAAPDVANLNHFVQSPKANENAAKAYRVGRDLIEDEKWEAAERHFRNFLRDYPKHKEATAAIYWLAFTQKKQAHFSEADQLLVRLIHEYPTSSWVRDAKAMRVELASSLGNDDLLTAAIASTAPMAPRPARPSPAAQAQAPTPMPALAPAPSAPATPPVAVEGFVFAPVPPGAVNITSGEGVSWVTVPGQSSNSGMDEKDEIKAIALQSLMQSSPERALPYIADILKNDSKASKGLKDSAVRLLGQYRGPKTTSLLLDLARNQTDSRLRRSAIYMLGNAEDDKVFDLLLDLATKSTDADVAKAALQALSRHRNQKARDMVGSLASTAQSPLIRRDAIFLLGDRSDDASVDSLIKIYDTESDPEIKKYAINALSRSSHAKARQKLLDIARSNGNEEVRLQAIQWLDSRGDASFVDELVKLYQNDKSLRIRKQVIQSLSQIASRGARYFTTARAVGGQGLTTSVAPVAIARTGLSSSESNTAERAEKAVKALLSLYDSESDEAMKSQMLFAFSQSKSKDAMQKLMQVARTDTSMTLRKKAVVYLGQSNDPEASKILEEILK